HLMPESSKSPKFLYYFHNLRFHWFDDFYEQAKIDSTLHYLQMARIAIESTADSVAHRVLALHSAETAFQSQFARIQRARRECQRGFRKYFSANTLRFLLRIEDALKLQQFQLLCEKVNLLGCISVAPIESLREIQLYQLLRSFPSRLPPVLKKQYDQYVAVLESRVSPNYEIHLKRYFSEWAYYASLKTLTAEQLQAVHERSEKDEAALMVFLPVRWSFRVEKIRELRLSNQLKSVELWAGMGLIDLFRERPTLLQQQIQDEIHHLTESLEEYIRDYVEEFNYVDQKHYLMQLITSLRQEGVSDVHESQKLLCSDKSFLALFPEINFFINVMLKLKSTEKLFPTLNNIPDVKHHLDEIYRFIRRQEGMYLNKNNAKFVQLFCREATLAEKQLSIYPLRRIIR
ncbi:MAG: hypothetical protein SFW07_03660, partial [Gammaproteobacteria bacterium]|nr:hypothetical protein [Gammaproteobacteria bacterium]